MPTPPQPQALAEHSWQNATWKLGAFWDPTAEAVTFAVYSKHATCIVLEIYDQPSGSDAIAEFVLAKNPSDHIWRAKIAGIKAGALYAFRCWGENWPYDPTWKRGNSAAGFQSDFDAQGNRFNPNKVLFDPYARELSTRCTSMR
jgi:isoamylase